MGPKRVALPGAGRRFALTLLRQRRSVLRVNERLGSERRLTWRSALPPSPCVAALFAWGYGALATLLALATLCGSAAAEPIRAEHLTLDLIAPTQSIQPGERFIVGLLLDHEEHWHTYWENPGDSGEPPQLTWNLPEGFSASPILWQTPHRIRVGPLVNYGYKGRIVHPLKIQAPASLKPGEIVRLEAEAYWLVCREECIPGEATLALEMPVSEGAAAPSQWAELFHEARGGIPGPLPAGEVSLASDGANLVLSLSADATGRVPESADVSFFPRDQGIVDNAAPQKALREGGRLQLVLERSGLLTGMPEALNGLLVIEPQSGIRKGERTAYDITARPAPTAAAWSWQAILFAFLGGLLLNLMPCVFPVLSIKILSFVEHGQSGRGTALSHAGFYAAGIIGSFWLLAGALLALRTGGVEFGWGFQLQNPIFVIVLGHVIFLLGLSLLSVFEIRTTLMGAGSGLASRKGWAGSFWTGVLAVLVATPCTAPFMGPAIGFALAASAATALAVFSALGAGMALPYVVLAAWPRALKALPRPGSWMETFRQLMAFPLFATVIWLAWVLAKQRGASLEVVFFGSLLVSGFGAWIWGKSQHGSGRHRMGGRIAGGLIGIAAVVGAALFASTPPPAGLQATETQAQDAEGLWQPYSAALVEQATAAGRRVFVNFTAAWCITCQVNEQTTFSSERVQRAFRERNVLTLKADWTDGDPEIGAALDHFGRNSVPLYLYYDGTGSEPQILPQVLTPRIVLKRLEADTASESAKQ